GELQHGAVTAARQRGEGRPGARRRAGTGDHGDWPRRSRPAGTDRRWRARAAEPSRRDRRTVSETTERPLGETAGYTPAVSICADGKAPGTVAAMSDQLAPHQTAHDIVVLFSNRSRDAYATEAIARGETYTFTDAWGMPRTWVKGEYAYLAPNAAG